MRNHAKKMTAYAAGLLLGSAVWAAPTPFKMGVVLPMSGDTATFGTETYSGMQLAVEEINKEGVVKVELKLEDDKSGVTDAANAIQKLINIDKVPLVLGSINSSNTNAMAPIAQAAKVPLMSPGSTNVNVTQRGEYISRVCFIDDFQGEAMAKFAAKDRGAKTAAIVIDSSSDYSKGLAKSFRESFKKLGGQIVVEVEYVQKDRDFSSQLTKIKLKKPDVVFVPGYYTEVASMIKQAKTLRLIGDPNNPNSKMVFLGGDGWDSPKLYEIGGAALIGQYFSNHFSEEDNDPKVKKFVSNYQSKFKAKPGAMAALGYDSIVVAVDAFKRAGMKADPKALMTAINATKNVSGVTGVITMDKNRNPIKPLVILQTQKDGASFVSRVNP